MKLARRAYRDKDDQLHALDMRMQECGHRFHRFSDLRQVCLDCEDAGEEAVIGTQEMYRRQEGMDPR